MTTSTVSAESRYDYTPLPLILRSGIALGLLQSALVGLFGFLQPRLEGILELVVSGAILLVGIAITIVMPGQRTRARTIEGIAGAANIGFAAAIGFLIVDVVLFQPIGLYTNRWLEIGGGVNWWYHPVWWMLNAFLAWMGAWIQANQIEKRGQASPAMLVLGTYVLAILSLGIAILIKFPGAKWSLGAFAVAVIPALILFVVITSLSARTQRS
ncbi:MAG: hypothetical protein ACT4PM_01480 [Gemmatimonadales bacterium]